MAQKVSVEIIDDLDGGEATQTVPFGLDGVQYEIDLSDENAEALREVLDRYVAAGTRTGGRKLRVAAGQSTAAGSGRTTTASDRERNQQVRAWASENGYQVAERGRIPNEIYEAFDNADSGDAQVDDVELESVEEAPAKPARKRAPRKKKTDNG
ncbi:histone-like nucleoid-structuring protein Lsr2 [Amycolatopsis sp. CB00013]|uniref:histone-like nucleoid-structuring protein Lsr2 n=1 Tax=Amycolatopsis sp. CB00013 TaxID=1703945 RepID=UPI00093F2222|nr:Lsr2 family protein [Amycolatopsis sp. CB00013]OKJ97531.1 nucleoid-associated protein Lsr2 [Amycolatopsis sp. CB00013]